MPSPHTDQDSFISIDEKGVVIDLCPSNGNVIDWMGKYRNHHFLITSSSTATSLIGKPLPDGDIDVMLL